MARILYIGNDHPYSNSGLRAHALSRLGHRVKIYNPADASSNQLTSRVFGSIHYRTGYRLLQSRMKKWIFELICKEPTPDLIWVNGGELLGKYCLKILKSVGCPIILYNSDDPTGERDGRRFDSLLEALPYYDLCAVLRNVNINEYKLRGAKRVIRVFMSYDENFNQPSTRFSDIPEQFRSEVAFIGTWMPHERRDEFLLELIREGVPVSIWGDNWQKSARFSKLKSHWRGHALKGPEYAAGIQGAKICLGLLSKLNRDQHTRRSVEIPFAGSLLCAERTLEHLEMYKDGVEAVYWSNASECAALCKQLLNDDKWREEIRLAGMRRVRTLKVGNEDVCRTILNAVH